jgi:hypothetical protein
MPQRCPAPPRPAPPQALTTHSLSFAPPEPQECFDKIKAADEDRSGIISVKEVRIAGPSKR